MAHALQTASRLRAHPPNCGVSSVTSPAPTSSADRILVLVDRVPDPRASDTERRRVAELFEVVAAFGPPVTLLGWPPLRREAAEPLLRHGVDVVLDDGDWAAWLERRAFEFSHVLVHGFQLAGSLDPVLTKTQPQAYRILSIATPDSLCFEALGDEVHPLETEGLVTFVTAVRAQEDAVLRGADLVIAPTPRTREMAEEKGAGMAVVFRGATSLGEAQQGLSRSGLLHIGRFSSEPGAPDDDGIRWFLKHVYPMIRGATGSGLRILGEDARPWMRSLGEVAEVTFETGLADELALARAVVFPRTYGANPALAVAYAMAAGVPFVASPPAVAHLDVGRLPAGLIAEGAAEFADFTTRLLVDDDLWLELSEQLIQLADAWNAMHELESQDLATGLCELGLAPEPARSLPETREVTVAVRAAGGTLADFHPANRAFESELLLPGEEELERGVLVRVQLPLSEDDRYALWRSAHEPTSHDLERMHADCTSWELQPNVSIVMPVHDTDPEMLSMALESVREQVYPCWELCVVDDASASEETCRILNAHVASEPRIRFGRLPHNVGIVGASNAALELARGEFVAFMDHDDIMRPDALYWVVKLLNIRPELDFVYTDEDKVSEEGVRTAPFFKPDWSPDLLRCVNYVAHLAVIRRALIEEVGGFRDGLDGSQDYDLFLRVTERTTAIGHVARPLYSWRRHAESTSASSSAKPFADSAGKAALGDSLSRLGLDAEVESGHEPTVYRPRFALRGNPRVAVVIPTRDRVDLVSECVDAATRHTGYKNFEIAIIDNESVDPATLEYLSRFEGPVLRYRHRFNYARMTNLAAAQLGADYLLLLNNDAVVRTDGWIEAMLEYGQRAEVGVVGARLFFPDGRPQQEGIVLGVGGVAYNLDATGYFGYGGIARDCAATTGACMLTRRTVFWEVGGFDERLRVAYNDVDYCLRVGERGYRVIYTPEVELVHPESASRQSLHPWEDEEYFQERWGLPRSIRDPFHNPNVDLLHPLILRF